VVSALTSTAAQLPAADAARLRPNILWITSEDHGPHMCAAWPRIPSASRYFRNCSPRPFGGIAAPLKPKLRELPKKAAVSDARYGEYVPRLLEALK
jgi:hypothetical protein